MTSMLRAQLHALRLVGPGLEVQDGDHRPQVLNSAREQLERRLDVHDQVVQLTGRG